MMYGDIEKYILKRLNESTPIGYNSFRKSRANTIHKLFHDEFNNILK